MKENLTQEEKQRILREHNDKIAKARIMLLISAFFPLAVISSLDKISGPYVKYLFYGSNIIFLIAFIRLLMLSFCPFCGHFDPRFTSKYRHAYSDYCINCKEKIR